MHLRVYQFIFPITLVHDYHPPVKIPLVNTKATKQILKRNWKDSTHQFASSNCHLYLACPRIHIYSHPSTEHLHELASICHSATQPSCSRERKLPQLSLAPDSGFERDGGFCLARKRIPAHQPGFVRLRMTEATTGLSCTHLDTNPYILLNSITLIKEIVNSDLYGVQNTIPGL